MRVETRAPGRRRRADLEVDLHGTMPVRELVAALVRDEVEGYEQRRAERVLTRVLGPAEIADGAARGVVDSGGRRTPPAPNREDALATAVEAFTDGLWFVFVDDRRIESLDDVVEVGPTTTVRFVRLVALAGG